MSADRTALGWHFANKIAINRPWLWPARHQGASVPFQQLPASAALPQPVCVAHPPSSHACRSRVRNERRDTSTSPASHQPIWPLASHQWNWQASHEAAIRRQLSLKGDEAALSMLTASLSFHQSLVQGDEITNTQQGPTRVRSCKCSLSKATDTRHTSDNHCQHLFAPWVALQMVGAIAPQG